MSATPASHARFAVLNRTVNPVVKAVLRSPLHRLLRRVVLITVTGRRSGREHTFPTGFSRDGERVRIVVGSPERKVWWRNLLTPAPVRLRIEGENRIGTAKASGDEQNGVVVDVDPDPRL